ncbi:tRNA methyltransferase, has a role in tRNA modification [Pleurotus pulmonarius]|nr:tRNA methyltransferase, has a role in tRNA modification [Pleurotus pulmonarius]
MAPKVETTVVDQDAQKYEQLHVHEVYEQIASHFSSTRYKPWPVIANFLASLPTGWVGLDSGTGNGKYLPLPSDRPGSLLTIGMDRSRNLLHAARTAGDQDVIREVVRGDVLDNPWRRGVFDYCISIATIHHLATHERRKQAIQRTLQAVSPSHGRVLIYVWAIDQDELSKRQIPTDNETHAGQDVFVPWVLSNQKKSEEDSERSQSQVYNRYYHMFAKGELAALVREAATELGMLVEQEPTRGGEELSVKGVEVVQDGWERSNYYVELRLWQIDQV